MRFSCSYAGIVPSSKQTGGPNQAPKTGPVRARCNRIAKDWVVQCGAKIGLMGPDELKTQYQQLLEKGQHADFAMAKRFLRIAKDLMSRQAAYLPKALLDPNSLAEARAAHHLDLWPRLLCKWKGLVDLDYLFAPAHPLGRSRQMIQESYRISLPLKNSSAPGAAGNRAAH